MSDDLFESFGDEDLFADEEDEELSGEAEGEGQNRTFIIAVAVLGGLLVCALAAFGVWAFVINPRQARNQASEAVPSPSVTPTVMETAQVTTTNVPTDTPEPEPTETPTPVMGPTRTPTPEVTETLAVTPGTDDETGEAGAEVPGGEDGDGEDVTPTATLRPRRTATPRPTPTTRPEDPAAGDTNGLDGDEELSQTGLGEWLMAGAALLLLGVALLARRLRRA
jgi:cytoskeletal protein RodZ